MTPTATLRAHLAGCQFLAEALAAHPDNSGANAWAVATLAIHLGEARTMLATIETKLAADPEPSE